jgi:hypothetical protein
MSKTTIIFCALALVLAGSLQVGATGYNSLAAFQSAAGPLTLVNFDTDQNGNLLNAHDPLAGRYTSWGVDFGTLDYVDLPIGPVSPPNGWFVLFPTDPFTATFSLSNVFAAGVHHVLYSGDSGATLTAYDNLNNFIESVASDSDINTLDFFGLIANTPIAKVIVTFNLPAYGWGLDDLYFGGQVPIPGAVWLLGSGLLGLVGLRKKFGK